jgi:hypothetical protein
MHPSKKDDGGGRVFFLKIVVEYFHFFATVPHPVKAGGLKATRGVGIMI